MEKPNTNQEEYSNILRQAVAEIRDARNIAAKHLAKVSNSTYWNLGKLLFEKQLEEGYGSGVVKQLSFDLKKEFPDMGLSPRNLWNMKRYYERYYQADEKLLRSVAVLPWSHNLLLLDKLKSYEEVTFYANQTIEKGWTRDLLLNAIKMDSFSQLQKQIKSHNFNETLPALDNLPDPDVLAEDIIENLEAGLASFREIMITLNTK